MACTSATLTGISLGCLKSMGGIKRALFISASDVQSVAVATTASGDVEIGMIETITLAQSAKFKEFQLVKQSSSMTSTKTVDLTNGVNFCTTEVVMQFKHMDNAKRISLEALTQSDVIGIVEDNNGHYWYLGKDFEVSCSAATGETGTAFTDGNQYTITMSDFSLEFPYEVAPSIIAGLL